MKILPYILIIIIPAMIGIAFSTEEPQKPIQPESRLIVIGGYLLRVTGDQVTVLWIHPNERTSSKPPKNFSPNWQAIP